MQLFPFKYVDLNGIANLNPILALAVVVNELTIWINQVEDDCVIDL